LRRQQRYDEFIAATDAHFGKLLDFFETNGFFDDSYIFLTSDHGELFERGIHGHTNEYLYESIVRIPLLVSTPGQRERVDVYTPTSSVDVLPTVLSALGKQMPTTLEGIPLPGFGGSLAPDPERAVYSFVSKRTPARGRLAAYSVSVRKGDHKLIKYLGYKFIPETYELYDLRNDPEERNNLYQSTPALSEVMRTLLSAKLEQINR
jgi:arylsulfatase A-like enzyme